MKTSSLRFLLCSLCLTVVLSGISRAQTAQLETQLDGNIEEINVETPVFSSETPSGVYWQKEIRKLGTKYFRLHIASAEIPSGRKISLKLYARNGSLVRIYSEEELRTRSPFWTVIIPGDYVLLMLFSDAPPVGLKLHIDKIAYQADSGAPLSTYGEDDKKHLVEYSNLPIIVNAAKPVAKLHLIKNSSPRVCTGFLVGQNTLMTNHHCVDSQEICDSVIATFGYERKQDGRLNLGEQYRCVKVDSGRMDFELDYAVIELQGTPGDKWGKLDLSAIDPEDNEPLFIVQHPAGEPKQVSRIDCKTMVIPVKGRGEETDFTHTCDTVGGSSGSPVFNEAGQVIGIHHYGFKEIPEDEEWKENRAIRMVKIVGKLNENRDEDESKELESVE